MLYARLLLERLEHIKQNIFALLEVKETFAGFSHVGFFTGKSRRVSVTTPAWEAAGGKVFDARRKCGQEGWNEEHHPLISQETFETVKQ